MLGRSQTVLASRFMVEVIGAAQSLANSARPRSPQGTAAVRQCAAAIFARVEVPASATIPSIETAWAATSSAVCTQIRLPAIHVDLSETPRAASASSDSARRRRRHAVERSIQDRAWPASVLAPYSTIQLSLTDARAANTRSNSFALSKSQSFWKSLAGHGAGDWVSR